MLLHGKIVCLRKDDMVTTSESFMIMTILPLDRNEEELEMMWFRPHEGMTYYSQLLGMDYDEAFSKVKVGSTVAYTTGCAGIIVED